MQEAVNKMVSSCLPSVEHIILIWTLNTWSDSFVDMIFKKRQESTHIYKYIHLQVGLWRLEVALHLGLKSDILACLHSQKDSKDQLPEAKFVATQDYEFDDWNSQETHHVCF